MKPAAWRRFGLNLGASIAIALGLAACGSGSDPAEPDLGSTPDPVVPERSITLTGNIERPATLTLTDLKARPATTQEVSYTAGSTPTARTYVGTSLWTLIDEAGVKITPNSDIRNHYVLSSAGDGLRVVHSLGELSPRFGNRPSLVAYGEVKDGQTVGLDSDGLIRITSPGDVRGGRYVSDLRNLDVRKSASTIEGTAEGGLSERFAVGGNAVKIAGTWDVPRLQAMPAKEVTVGTDVYRGVDLWTFLNDAAVGLDQAAANQRNWSLTMLMVATGSDGLKAVLSLGEIDPAFGNKPAMIAYEINGGPIDRNGFARLVVPEDSARGRFVSNLIGVEAFIAAPTPVAAP